METEIKARHRLGGRHSDVILAVPPHTRPSGRRSAARSDNVVVPPRPDHAPTVHQKEREHGKHRQDEAAGVIVVPAVADARVPINTGPLKTVRPTRKNRGAHKIAAIATGGVLLATGGVGMAMAAMTKPPTKVSTQTSQLSVVPVSGSTDLEQEKRVEPVPISAASDAVVEFEEVTVESIAAPVPEPEPEVFAAPPAPVVVAAPPVVAPVPTPRPVAAGSKQQIILSAAMGQIGEYQDCVKMVADALAAAGIYWYKWPHEYYGIGYAVSAAEAMPGDLIYYVDGGAGVGHIAVYAGNGMAVHGGYNGNQTVVFSAYVGSGPQFIRVTA